MGYVGVVLRSHRDILDNTSMERAREIEAHYFRQRREYDAVSACCGVGVLAERLNKVLAKSIRDGLPSVRQALEKALEKKKRESRVYGEVCHLRVLATIDGVLGRDRKRRLSSPSSLCRSSVPPLSPLPHSTPPSLHPSLTPPLPHSDPPSLRPALTPPLPHSVALVPHLNRRRPRA